VVLPPKALAIVRTQYSSGWLAFLQNDQLQDDGEGGEKGGKEPRNLVKVHSLTESARQNVVQASNLAAERMPRFEKRIPKEAPSVLLGFNLQRVPSPPKSEAKWAISPEGLIRENCLTDLQLPISTKANDLLEILEN